ncbi:MAG: class I SAM-dependent methyltransferase [Burkholderiaceae bacterium]|jgi:SAM-dependent methyltransferase|nr:class I SAM-dependent methyltransferase [Burkholderiaceae bacterium]
MGEPSAWVQRFAGLARPGGSALDLACGSGRHLRWLAARGFAVTGVDRDVEALAPLAGLGELIVADIEAGPWPLAGRRFDAVVVTNYLWRPLIPRIAEALAEEGVLMYETFAQGQESIGRPSRAEFLLAPGELLAAFAGLRVVAFEDGFEQPSAPGAPRFVQRLAAVRLPADEAGAEAAAKIRRFPLQP